MMTKYNPGDFIKIVGNVTVKKYSGVIMQITSRADPPFTDFYFLLDTDNESHLWPKRLIERKATEREVKRYQKLKVAKAVAGK